MLKNVGPYLKKKCGSTSTKRRRMNLGPIETVKDGHFFQNNSKTVLKICVCHCNCSLTAHFFSNLSHPISLTHAVHTYLGSTITNIDTKHEESITVLLFS